MTNVKTELDQEEAAAPSELVYSSRIWSAIAYTAGHIGLEQKKAENFLQILQMCGLRLVDTSITKLPDIHCGSCCIGPEGHEYDCPEAQY